MLTDCYPPAVGGIEAHVYGLAAQIAQQGIAVDVITHRRHASGPLRAAEEAVDVSLPGSRVFRIGGQPVHWGAVHNVVNFRLQQEVGALLHAGNYDVVHSHSLGCLVGWAGLPVARQMGLPTVITKHSMVLERRWRPISRALLRLDRWMARRWADQLIAVSRAGADELAGFGLPVETIPNGVDCDHWRPDGQLRGQTRKRLGFGPDDVVVGYLSRLVPAKDPLAMVNLAERLRHSAPAVKILVVGDGPLRSALESRIAGAGLAAQFCLVGAVPWQETPELYNAMDVFAFPSRTEAFGLVLAEAMACGVPPVARSSGGAREIVMDGETGYLVGSEDEFQRRVVELVADGALRERLGQAARRRVVERYDWSVAAARTAEVYGALARRKELA